MIDYKTLLARRDARIKELEHQLNKTEDRLCDRELELEISEKFIKALEDGE